MDLVTLSRIQFGWTISFHYIFPCISIGLSWLIVYMMTKYLRSGDETWRRASRIWIHAFAVTFVIGVATGITMEFQIGTNWADLARFAGDIFGAPLAAEVLFAFFLESTFLGLLIFGEKRLTPRGHWFSALMVALGSTFSAFWIIVANSWQQTPAGYAIVDGRAELQSFVAAVLNPSTLPRFLHTMLGSLVAGAFFILTLSYLILRKNPQHAAARLSVRFALVVALVGSLLQPLAGHYHAMQVAEYQPAKLAAFEGHFETGTNAPFTLFGIPDEEAGELHLAVQVPGLLSLLMGFDDQTPVQGLNDFPREDWPPLLLSFGAFHLMVGLGMLFILVAAWGLWLRRKDKLFVPGPFWKVALAMTPLAVLANELGWMSAEVGRQPWIVQGLLRTSDGVSSIVPVGQVVATLILFIGVYGLLFFTWVTLLHMQMTHAAEEHTPTVKIEEG